MPKQPPPYPDDAIERLVSYDQMRLVLAIVEARSFSGAAAALGVSQPSISQQVKRIERAAGRTLFRRRSAGVELTADGEAVVVYARAMLELTDDLRRHLRDNDGTTRICVGMSEDFCRGALPSVLYLFMREHPKVDLRVISGPYEMLVNAIATREVDLAVMRRFPVAGQMSHLCSEPVRWGGRADLALPIADPIPLVLPTGPSPMRDEVFDALRRNHRSWRVVFESSSLTGVEAALQAGLGVCIAPVNMPLPGTIRFDERCGLPPMADVEYVLVEPSPSAPPAVRVFADLLRHAAALSFRQSEDDGPARG